MILGAMTPLLIFSEFPLVLQRIYLPKLVILYLTLNGPSLKVYKKLSLISNKMFNKPPFLLHTRQTASYGKTQTIMIYLLKKLTSSRLL
uniref:Uncharacterized protein n=1 Tax=Medicago truncatula TaxID=3880 RepID=A2Q313_MEDTR|nr:hypothetical protein MtrDRAFT_AC154113g12v2 [Medicago truncatula]